MIRKRQSINDFYFKWTKDPNQPLPVEENGTRPPQCGQPRGSASQARVRCSGDVVPSRAQQSASFCLKLLQEIEKVQKLLRSFYEAVKS